MTREEVRRIADIGIRECRTLLKDIPADLVQTRRDYQLRIQLFENAIKEADLWQ